jgi:hypothetical protein
VPTRSLRKQSCILRFSVGRLSHQKDQRLQSAIPLHFRTAAASRGRDSGGGSVVGQPASTCRPDRGTRQRQNLGSRPVSTTPRSGPAPGRSRGEGIYHHSTTHIMAQAVKASSRDQITIGLHRRWFLRFRPSTAVHARRSGRIEARYAKSSPFHTVHRMEWPRGQVRDYFAACRTIGQLLDNSR